MKWKHSKEKKILKKAKKKIHNFFCSKCCTLTKTQISSLVLNIFEFGFVPIKCP